MHIFLLTKLRKTQLQHEKGDEKMRRILSELIKISDELKEIRKELQIIKNNLKPNSKLMLDKKTISQAVLKANHDKD